MADGTAVDTARPTPVDTTVSKPDAPKNPTPDALGEQVKGHDGAEASPGPVPSRVSPEIVARMAQGAPPEQVMADLASGEIADPDEADPVPTDETATAQPATTEPEAVRTPSKSADADPDPLPPTPDAPPPSPQSAPDSGPTTRRPDIPPPPLPTPEAWTAPPPMPGPEPSTATPDPADAASGRGDPANTEPAAPEKTTDERLTDIKTKLKELSPNIKLDAPDIQDILKDAAANPEGLLDLERLVNSVNDRVAEIVDRSTDVTPELLARLNQREVSSLLDSYRDLSKTLKPNSQEEKRMGGKMKLLILLLASFAAPIVGGVALVGASAKNVH